MSKQHDELSIAQPVIWDLEAMRLVLAQLNSFQKVRLLIGREPLILRHQLASPELDYPDQEFSFDLSVIAPKSNLKTVDILH